MPFVQGLARSGEMTEKHGQVDDAASVNNSGLHLLLRRKERKLESAPSSSPDFTTHDSVARYHESAQRATDLHFRLLLLRLQRVLRLLKELILQLQTRLVGLDHFHGFSNPVHPILHRELA